ncbi:MAG: hypothetical protein LBN32_02545 [Helicobacteraceae bacterium]|nr:hypothetical protein [Helicobacteraceae bacterium]
MKYGAFRAAWLMTLALLCGCANTQPRETLGNIPYNAPDWVENPTSAYEYAASGKATLMNNGHFQQIAAFSQAKKNLGLIIAKLTRKALANLQYETSKNSGDMIAAFAISHSAPLDIWWSPFRECFVLVAIEKERLRTMMIDALARLIRVEGHEANSAKIAQAVDKALNDDNNGS